METAEKQSVTIGTINKVDGMLILPINLQQGLILNNDMRIVGYYSHLKKTVYSHHELAGVIRRMNYFIEYNHITKAVLTLEIHHWDSSGQGLYAHI